MSSTRPEKTVIVAGLRSIPDVEGGVESVVQNLYPPMANMQWDVTVVVRSRYYDRKHNGSWNGLRLKPIWAPKQAGAEALIHTLLATLYAIVKRPDIYHIHAVGPALFAPLARLFGLRVVVTHHGQDYQREKWGKFARGIIKLGELCGMRFANERIVISRAIDKAVQEQYGLASNVIPNGVNPPSSKCSSKILRELGLQPKRYILQVSRFVPEKRQTDLIAAFKQAKLEDWHLVLVGRADSANEYAQEARALAGDHPNIVFAGFQSGPELESLLAKAGMFVLPSSHEGLPVALLEALSHGLRAIASDIAANLEVGLEPKHYTPLGDIQALSIKLRDFAFADDCKISGKQRKALVAKEYNWSRIAERTISVYDSALTTQAHLFPVRALK